MRPQVWPVEAGGPNKTGDGRSVRCTSLDDPAVGLAGDFGDGLEVGVVVRHSQASGDSATATDSLESRAKTLE